MAYVGPILSHVGLVGGHVGAILGLRETYVGQFLGPSLRAKNSVIFSAFSAKSKLQGTDKKWDYLSPIFGSQQTLNLSMSQFICCHSLTLLYFKSKRVLAVSVLIRQQLLMRVVIQLSSTKSI